MGRRSLPAVDKNIDLSDFLFSFVDLPDDWSPLALFDEAGDLEIDVGSGKGLFFAHAAKRHPERNYLGVELARKYAWFSAARLARNGLQNAKQLHGDAMRLFQRHLPSGQVAAVHVYFPDPWWKKRHRKRRILNDAFLREVQRVLRTGGLLHFWTDVKEYFETSLEQIDASTTLEGPHAVEESPAEHDLDYRTHFERRMRHHDQPVYRSLFVNAD